MVFGVARVLRWSKERSVEMAFITVVRKDGYESHYPSASVEETLTGSLLVTCDVIGGIRASVLYPAGEWIRAEQDAEVEG